MDDVTLSPKIWFYNKSQELQTKSQQTNFKPCFEKSIFSSKLLDEPNRKIVLSSIDEDYWQLSDK